MSSSEERSYLNYMKGILIILVVAGHFFQVMLDCAGESMKAVTPLIEGSILFIYAFHMPVFVFISGYLSKNKEKRRQNAFFDLFLLYLIYEIIVGGIYLVLSPQKGLGVFQNLLFPRYASWYLLSLFIWRLLLPDLVRIKGILWIAFVLNLGTCLFADLGSSFDLRRTLGFLFYFLLGYYASDEVINRIQKHISCWLARFGLGIELVVFILVLHYYPIYPRALYVFVRKVSVDEFSHWYYAISYYAIAFFVTIVTGLLFVCAIKSKNNHIEKIGADTMPLYLSHAIIYHIVGDCLRRVDILPGIAEMILICVIGLLCIFLFSTKYYRNLFWSFVHGIIHILKKQQS